MRYFLLFLVLTVAPAFAQANELFEQYYEERLRRSPMEMSRLGMKDGYGLWDDLSDEEAGQRLAITRKYLALVTEQVNPDLLDAETRLSYDLFVQRAREEIEDFRWRFHNYPVNQMFGTHAEVPAFLINVHRVDSVPDAEAYISRLNGVPMLFAQLIDSLEERERRGIMPPRFVFDYVIDDCKRIAGGDSLAEDFRSKVEALDLPLEQEQELLGRASRALETSVRPAYGALIAFLEGQRTRASTSDGAWKLPDGEAFYANALQRTTTTDLSAGEIHELGLAEVERIQGEMRAIMDEVGFEGPLTEFFKFMETSEQFYYPDTEAGKAAYVADATGLIETMKGRLDSLFITKPKADLLVKRVESFRERSAGKAFYETPALDGSRPGIYYVNLLSTRNQPRYEMEALAYHEGLPGHHMQLSIAQELEGLPRFRRFAHYTAYIEGWGLYCELLPKEIGFYEDPYSDFGRLAMELWRACRLVVDTGIHSRKWTREQATDYYRNNTPGSERNCVSMVDRHIVMPSQATAYKVGMNRILELRSQAQEALGEKFDLREFHEVVLTHGPLPLNMLEDQVGAWVASEG